MALFRPSLSSLTKSSVMSSSSSSSSLSMSSVIGGTKQRERILHSTSSSSSMLSSSSSSLFKSLYSSQSFILTTTQKTTTTTTNKNNIILCHRFLSSSSSSSSSASQQQKKRLLKEDKFRLRTHAVNIYEDDYEDDEYDEDDDNDDDKYYGQQEAPFPENDDEDDDLDYDIHPKIEVDDGDEDDDNLGYYDDDDYDDDYDYDPNDDDHDHGRGPNFDGHGPNYDDSDYDDSDGVAGGYNDIGPYHDNDSNNNMYPAGNEDFDDYPKYNNNNVNDRGYTHEEMETAYLAQSYQQQEDDRRAKWIENAKPKVRYQQIDPITGQSFGRGSRKEAIAQVYICPGEGIITINSNRDFIHYFPRESHREDILGPFIATNTCGQFDVYATVHGGGSSGQAGAIRLGIARALEKYNPDYRPPMKRLGFMTRDSRMVEPKKVGKKKARKAPQWVRR